MILAFGLLAALAFLPATLYLPSYPNLLRTIHSPVGSHHLARLAHRCHTHAIRLAARIWGTIVLHHHSTTSESKLGAGIRVSRVALLHDSNLSLPPHLQCLLHL